MSQDSPKLINETDYKQVLKEKLSLEAENQNLKTRNHSLESQVSRLRSKGGVSSEPVSPKEEKAPRVEEETQESAPGAEPTKKSEPEALANPHSVQPWQKVCVDCHVPNPQFQPGNFVKCKNCGEPFSKNDVEELKKIPACPSCGATGKIAVPIK